jgi:hypothetical protein
MLNQGGITKMVVPTIMQCNMGGYLVSMPGIGTMAASTIEEIMAFVEQRTLEHFKAKKSEFPKVIREKAQAVRENIFGSETKEKRLDGVMIAIVLAGLLVGWTLFGGFHNDGQGSAYNEGQKRSSGAQETARPSLSGDRGSGETARKQGSAVLPEIHLLKVRPTSDDTGAKRSIQDGLLRPVQGNN